ncbi:MAG: hypothetical protein ACRDRH_21660 [Pseudonocardia sp.]
MLSHPADMEDPLLDVQDRLPVVLASPPVSSEDAVDDAESVHPEAPMPLGMRLAVYPRAGEHSKTYETVTETKDTERSDDGKVYMVPDTTRREVEVD